MKKHFGLLVAFGTFCTGAWADSLTPQTMRDWTVSCRDNRYCVAQTQGQSEAGDEIVFKLERGNKPGSKIFVTTKPIGPALALGMKVDVDVVDHDYHFFGDVKKVYKGNEMAFVEPFDAKTLKKLQEGRFAEISVEFGGATGTIVYRVSLQGVSSVLAMMDVVQGRLDREDAAVIRGGEAMTSIAAYDLSAGLAPPTVEADEKDENVARAPDDVTSENIEDSGLGQAQLVYNQDEVHDRVLIHGFRVLGCDLPATIEGFGAQIINIDPGRFLHLIPCNMADVNVPYYAVMEDAGVFTPLDFQHSSIEEEANPSLIINPQWDQASRNLTGHTYYSPSYDCGSHERHRLDEQEGAFYLSEFRMKENCDGVVSLPETYPLAWNGEGD